MADAADGLGNIRESVRTWAASNMLPNADLLQVEPVPGEPGTYTAFVPLPPVVDYWFWHDGNREEIERG